MKKLELYECEICETRYKCQTDAIACERKHTTVDHIGYCRYIPTQRDPVTVEIWFSDGSHRIYKEVE